MALKQLRSLSGKALIIPILLATAYIFYAGLVGHGVDTFIQVYRPFRHNDTTPGVPAQPQGLYVDNNRSNTVGHGRLMGSFVLHKLRIRTGQVVPEDLMKAGPFDFLPNYRNPCWKTSTPRRTGVPIKCLPYFYLMGAPKAGTTDLYSNIIRHPSVSSLTRKEPHWLPRKHYYGNKLSDILPKLDDYIDMFPKAIADIYTHNDSAGWHPKVFGDGSASTMWHNDYWTLLPEFNNRSEPLYTNADYIHHINPKTKFIAILRNPIDRLYSDYLYFTRNNKSPQLFHDAVVDILSYMQNCLNNRTLRDCVYHKPPENIARARVRIGIYYIYLEDYFRVFPRQQVLVLKLEEYSEDIPSNMKKVFQFLELEPIIDSKGIAGNSTKPPKNSRRQKDKAVGGMLPETRELLYKFYYPYNVRLAELLGKTFDYNAEQ